MSWADPEAIIANSVVVYFFVIVACLDRHSICVIGHVVLLHVDVHVGLYKLCWD